MKGAREPVHASQLIRAKEREHHVATAPVVGRDRELASLHERASTTSLPGAAASFSSPGAPGIGKTRLLTELATATADRVTWLEGRCHSYGGLPGWPSSRSLLGWLGAEIGEPEIAIRTKARAGLGALFGGELDGSRAARRCSGCDSIADTRTTRRPRARSCGGSSASHRASSRSSRRSRTRSGPTLRLASWPSAYSSSPIAGGARPDRGADSRLGRCRAPLACAAGLRAPSTSELPPRPLRTRRRLELLAGIVGDELDRATRVGLIREAEGNPSTSRSSRGRSSKAPSSRGDARGR